MPLIWTRSGASGRPPPSPAAVGRQPTRAWLGVRRYFADLIIALLQDHLAATALVPGLGAAPGAPAALPEPMLPGNHEANAGLVCLHDESLHEAAVPGNASARPSRARAGHAQPGCQVFGVRCDRMLYPSTREAPALKKHMHAPFVGAARPTKPRPRSSCRQPTSASEETRLATSMTPPTKLTAMVAVRIRLRSDLLVVQNDTPNA